MRRETLLKFAIIVANGISPAHRFLPFVTPIGITCLISMKQFAYNGIVLSAIVSMVTGFIIFSPYLFLRHYLPKNSSRQNWDFSAIDSPEQLQNKLYVWHVFSGIMALASCFGVFYGSIVSDDFPNEFIFFGCLMFGLASSHFYIVFAPILNLKK